MATEIDPNVQFMSCGADFLWPVPELGQREMAGNGLRQQMIQKSQ
jgi:hypothetical protein